MPVSICPEAEAKNRKVSRGFQFTPEIEFLPLLLINCPATSTFHFSAKSLITDKTLHTTMWCQVIDIYIRSILYRLLLSTGIWSERWKYSKFLSCSPNIKGPNMTYSASLFGVNSKLDNMKIIFVGAILSNTSIQKFGHIRNWGSKKFDAK